MQTGVSASPGYYVQGNIGQGATPIQVESQSILGTPDVNLQPVLKCNPGTGLGRISISIRLLRAAVNWNQWPIH